MARITYIPERGDFVHANFSPSAGRELTGPHYALVLSPKSYNQEYGLVVGVPITSRIRGGPFEVFVPKGILPAKADAGEVNSVVRSDAIRQMDFRERSMTFIAKCPRDILDDVTLRALPMIDPTADF